MNRLKYEVFWSEEDQEWVAIVSGQPSMSWLAPTPEKALAGLVDIVYFGIQP